MLPSGVLVHHPGGQHAGAFDRQDIANPQPPPVARQRLPRPVRPRTVQRNANPRGAAQRLQLRRKHPGVVRHQHIPRPQQRRQIPDQPIGQAVRTDVQHAR